MHKHSEVNQIAQFLLCIMQPGDCNSSGRDTLQTEPGTIQVDFMGQTMIPTLVTKTPD